MPLVTVEEVGAHGLRHGAAGVLQVLLGFVRLASASRTRDWTRPPE
jgi:hypothetical protein